MESTEPEVDDELMGVFRESATRNRKLLVEALENQDWSAVKEVAHQVKGSGSSFGFSMLTEKAKDVCDVYDNDELADLSDLTRILVDELDKTLS
jgi:HPt (histidine-containing phosphotransfer) domain-containing protein